MTAGASRGGDRGTPSTGPAPLRVVLVGPRGGVNVGAVCRAMKNMGARELVVVAGAFDVEQARVSAVHAADVLDARRETATLRDAIEGCGLVVGTTARKGAFRDRSEDIRSLARELAAAPADADGGARAEPLPSAIVFGPEDTGLRNEDVAICHRLAYIPASDDYASLNLAQAVMICLYEIHRAALEEGARATSVGMAAHEGYPAAEAGEIEDALSALERSLVAIGFLPEKGAERVMAGLRSLLTRAGMDERELRIVRGVARQILWFAEGGREVAAGKRARGEKLR
jgi:tRNA/rRNA methyltransferase